VEQRRVRRHALSAPVIFSWTDPQGKSCHGGGFTRDISTAGMFVFSDAPPPLERPVQLQVLLPSFDGSAPGLSLNAAGRVVRVEIREGLTGFAATTDFGSD
jgi:PilZ domain